MKNCLLKRDETRIHIEQKLVNEKTELKRFIRGQDFKIFKFGKENATNGNVKQ
jgi:hypothetical protein